MDAQVNEIILKVYDASSDASLWPGVLQQIADAIGAAGCIVFEYPTSPQSGPLAVTTASLGYDMAVIETYVEKCRDAEMRDQRIFESHSLQHDQVNLIEDDVLAEDLAALKQLPNVQKLQLLGILHRAAGLLNKDNKAISRFSVQLPAHRGRLTDKERAILNTVLPHVAKALDLGRPAQQLLIENRSLIAALEHIAVGVCVLDSLGRVVTTNAEFDRQVEACDVFAKTPKGQLRLKDGGAQRQFAQLMEDARNHGQFGARPRKEAVGHTRSGFLCVELVPLPSHTEIGSNRFDGFVLYSQDTSRPVTCQTLPLKQAFGLTSTEIELADAISLGLTNRQISEQRARSLATVNSQVKAILAKTQCATRTEFVRLMMSFGADYVDRS